MRDGPSEDARKGKSDRLIKMKWQCVMQWIKGSRVDGYIQKKKVS